jgi:geranylgeranyl pyrophosphate synthase
LTADASGHAVEPPGQGEGASDSAPDVTAIPETRQLREMLGRHARQMATTVDKTYPLSTSWMDSACRELLAHLGLSERYLGWTMVMLLSAFWHDQLMAVPVHERLLLLPGVFEHLPGCDAPLYEGNGRSASCLACAIASYRAEALRLGYQVQLADSSSEMMKRIMAGEVNAVIGVAPLRTLERVIDKVVLTGIACQAIPLATEDGRVLDEDWILQMIRAGEVAARPVTRTYLPLMRAAAAMFEPRELRRLAPRQHGTADGLCRTAPASLEPLAATEAIAYDFLAKGGKHSRPFITLAAFDARTGGQATRADGAEYLARLPDAIRRTALSIETFHKASLIHDDIEDDDEFRYGDQTLHRRYGTATAINVGDYLIGLGYRLVSRETASLGAEVTADILDCLAAAHMRLSEGQGAELAWRDSRDKSLSPRDALRIYALKTAPAFEAALYAGLRLAGPIDGYRQAVGLFSRHLGIAFQILNDLDDWEADADNKRLAGGDVVQGRPTVLWALALAALSPGDRAELRALAGEKSMKHSSLCRIKDYYARAGVFAAAQRLVDKHQWRAELVASTVEPEEVRRLLFFLIDMVLNRPFRLKCDVQRTLVRQ